MKTIIFLALVLILSACRYESQSTEKKTNGIEVELLFEHDGCKVYRFYDGRTVYYTDCRGTTQSSYQSGKTTYYSDVTNSGKK